MQNLQRAYAVVGELLPESHRDVVEAHGLFDTAGSHLTIRCVDNRACIFVMYEDDVAKCSIQHAYQNGAFDWVKPRSCHLFPIRLRRGGRLLLEYEEFSECRPALERGLRENIPLVDFLERPLRHELGDEWYEDLRLGLRSAPDVNCTID